MNNLNIFGMVEFLATRGHKPWGNPAVADAEQRPAETPYPLVGSGSLSALTVRQ